ncbi:LysR family transcriptional regulator [Ottowia thiooxydans]|uniref:LysR family transcriptional regulator n=1 Tax=Ottowia thiooxydans TaxID=219182 RepID=UPI00041BB1DF|nr:LysR family transcriptional regulator [Ottowia thiooxydans]
MKRSLHAALPSVDSLLIFEQAARYASFTKAGEQLGLTQSAVSRQVIDLEALLGVKLFSRERQRVALTTAGVEFRELIKPVIQDLRAATLRMQMRALRSNVLNLSVAASFCNLWFIPNLPGYSALEDAAQINVMPHVGAVNFERGSIDAAIVNSTTPPENCESFKLMDIAMSPFASPSLLKRLGANKLEDLERIPAVDLQEQDASWAIYMAATSLKTPLDFVGQHSLYLLTFEVALTGLGVVLLPPEFVPSSGLGALKRLHKLKIPTGRSYYYCWPRLSNKQDAVALLGKWLAQELAAAQKRGSRTAAA